MKDIFGFEGLLVFDMLDFMILVSLFATSFCQTTVDTTQQSQPIQPPCVPGVKIGTVLISSPNQTSLVTIGSKFIISWKYTVITTVLPTYVDIKIQLIDNAIIPKFDQYVTRSLPLANGATSYVWNVPPLPDGSYKLRIVPDGKEIFNIGEKELPCFADGEANPGQSGIFRIINPKSITGYPDRFGPMNGSAKSVACIFAFVILVIVL